MKQEIQNLNEVNKYEQMIEYLKQDETYWINNDIWEIEKLGLKNLKNVKKLSFGKFLPENVKNEIKYAIVYSCKNKYIAFRNLMYVICPLIEKIEGYILKMQPEIETIRKIDTTKFLLYLLNIENLNEVVSKAYVGKMNVFKKYIEDFFDEREETQKDIWNCMNILGTKISATASRKGYTINFFEYPNIYRNCMKRYFRTIITKKSLSQCLNIHVSLVAFFENFKELGYENNFLKNLTRDDIEKYIFHINGKYQGKSRTYVNRLLAYPRTFLEYIQLANYEEAPMKEISLLIFQDDMPKREKVNDTLKKVKFIPTPILQQLDSNIMELDRPKLIPIYVLLRETGWRGTDILNLRYDNCLEKIWNGKEETYNYYLCGEITKTGIPQLKIPIRDTIANMLENCIKVARNLSTEDNNPNKYLFNVYDGKLKGRPIPKARLEYAIKKLIDKKNIQNENGELFHFKLHSLRHTRAKEYVEQGINISIIQQILGHRSLQMTIHYASVTENTLYEQWKNTEDLNLFQIDNDNKMQKIDTKDEENLIRYEFIRNNLDAVKVPFGICFKPSKIPCKQQINQCLTCASFCSTTENLQEYKEEIKRVQEQIKISEKCGRTLWKEKNEDYLKLLNNMVAKIEADHIVHKNGNSREEC